MSEHPKTDLEAIKEVFSTALKEFQTVQDECRSLENQEIRISDDEIQEAVEFERPYVTNNYFDVDDIVMPDIDELASSLDNLGKMIERLNSLEKAGPKTDVEICGGTSVCYHEYYSELLKAVQEQDTSTIQTHLDDGPGLIDGDMGKGPLVKTMTVQCENSQVWYKLTELANLLHAEHKSRADQHRELGLAVSGVRSELTRLNHTVDGIVLKMNQEKIDLTD
tara:strand:+ start:479 stop:1144 length:666 start_codon:yes stop_codon:yes gene_type:complete